MSPPFIDFGGPSLPCRLRSTHAWDTIRRDGFLRIQCSGIPPLLLEQMSNTLLTEFVRLFIVFLPQFRSLPLQDSFA